MESIVIETGDSIIRCFGEVERLEDEVFFGHEKYTRKYYRITLSGPLKDIKGDKVYPVELLSAKIKFMGWLSSDKTRIIQD